MLTPIVSGTLSLTQDCNLSCEYCTPPGSSILLSNFTTKPIEQIKMGDSVIGFEKSNHRKFYKLVPSIVIGIGQRLSPVIKIYTDKGDVYSSPDHRWFNGRHYRPAKMGGKIRHVFNNHLTQNRSQDYKIGWLCGVYAGDGNAKSYKYIYDGKCRVANRTRLEVKDLELIQQATQFSEELGFNQHYFIYEGMHAIRNETYGFLNFLKTSRDTEEFKRGWVAGFFDAEGSVGSSIRISQNENEYLTILQRYLLDFKFNFKYEDYRKCKTIRILGGIPEYIRFFTYFSPCLIRKPNKLYGTSLRESGIINDIQLESKQELVYSLTTTTGNYVNQGFASKNCFAYGKSNKRMSFETGQKCINYLLTNVSEANINNLPNKRREIEVGFWGGEPLLEWDLIKDLTNYAITTDKSKDILIKFSGTTNGILLTEDKFNFMEDNGLVFLVSIDGTQETHDCFRKFRNGFGSHAVIMRNMEKVLKRWPQNSVRMSVSADRVKHFFEDISYLRSAGFKDIMFSPVWETDWTEEKWNIFEEQYREVVKLNLDKRDFRMQHLESYAQPSYPSRFPCGAGRFYCGFSTEGAIFACHRFDKHDCDKPWWENEICLGHVDAGIMRTDFRQKFLERDRCPDCSFNLTQCNGGCPASNYDLSGSTTQIYMMCRYAEIMKRVADWWKGEMDKESNPTALIKELETEVVDRILAIEEKLGI